MQSQTAAMSLQQQQQVQQHQQQQHQHQLPPQMPTAGPFDSSSCRSLYVGNLHPYVTEAQLQNLFSTVGSVTEVKVKRDKATGMSAGYGFVKFFDHRSAEIAMHSLNTRLICGQELRVNWAYQKDQREDTSHHFHIFVGDLGSEINDRALFEAFVHCGDCSDAEVKWDHATGRSKGYGFVSFRTKEAAENGIALMSNKLVGHKRVRCGWAQHKQNTNTLDHITVDRADPQSCNVYVSNVSQDLSDAELRQHFSQFGHVTDVKLYRKGGYGFVNFTNHIEAVQAIVAMNGQMIGNKALKCSWGRHQPRQNTMFPVAMGPMQSQPGFVGNQNMLGSINPMLQLQSGMPLPNRLALPGQIQMPLPQHAQQQLQQQALLHAQQALGPQLNAPQGNVQQQMLAAQNAQLDPSSSTYFNMYGGLYGVQ